VEIDDGAVIKCNYESCVKVVSKSNIQSKTPSEVTHTSDHIFSSVFPDFAVNSKNKNIRDLYKGKGF
jgi:hypothetical protein